MNRDTPLFKVDSLRVVKTKRKRGESPGADYLQLAERLTCDKGFSS
jgi:hypothetical protein